MVTWIKAKYAVPKTKGKYRSSHNDGTRRAGKHKITNEKAKAEIRASQPHVVLVVTGSGKRTFVRSKK